MDRKKIALELANLALRVQAISVEVQCAPEEINEPLWDALSMKIRTYGEELEVIAGEMGIVGGS